MNMINKKIRDISLNPPLVLTLGFALLILTGSLLLNMNIFTKTGESIGFINALFTAGSASCVTGLVVVNTAEYWNFWGQLVIITLIQIGGLGIMTLATIFPIVMRKRIGLTSRQIIKEQLNVETLSGMVKLLKYVLVFSLFIEAIGAAIMAIEFIPTYGLKDGIWFSIFHSVSAFCNAGFDITGNSIVPFKNSYPINISIMSLVIIGGLGFQVSSELFRKKSIKKLSVHGKLVLLMTIFLIISGTLIFFVIEGKNPETIGGQTGASKVLQSFFQSVITRTAGFNSVDISKIHDTSAVLMIILMFIGGSPGSTAGGLKTTTFGVLIASMISTIRGSDSVILFKKRIPNSTILKALALVMISMMLVIGISFILTISEAHSFLDILFEVTSAYGTVGLTRGITSGLTDFGKLIITLTMYIGRIGPLTMAFAFGKASKASKLEYPDANINVG